MLPYLLLSLNSLIWGSTFIITKNTVSHYDPFALLTLRFLIASIVLYIWIYKKKLKTSCFLKFGIITGILQFLMYASQTIGLKYTSPSNSAFITGLFIVFIPIVNFLVFQKKPKLQDIIATIIAFIGIWIITGGIQQFNTGDLITLLAAIAYAVYIIVSAYALKKGINPIVLTFQQLLVTALISAAIAFYKKVTFIAPNNHTYISILYLGIFASFLVYVIQNTMLQKVNPILVSIIFSLEPVFALLFSWILKYELFSFTKLIGGGLIFIAIIIPDLKSSSITKNASSVIKITSEG